MNTLDKPETYTSEKGEEVGAQMYIFKDKKGRDLCLRPEVTLSVQDYYKKHMQGKKDVRLWYIEKCYRYERPQKGRYREFYQIGFELLNGTKEGEEECKDLAQLIVSRFNKDYTFSENAQRGLHYYKGGGFEISIEALGAQKQVCGGGRYECGYGFAIGLDRLALSIL